MQKYFISSQDFEEKVLRGEDAFHIKNVLRGKVGYRFLVSASEETFLVEITRIDNKEIYFDIIQKETCNAELPFFISLFQGYPKADKLENIIKYGTQLGVSEIHPTLMKRSVFKLDEKKKDSKLERFNKIAKEAAEQSLRNKVPKIKDIKQLTNINFDEYDIKIVCYEESAKNDEKSAFKSAIQVLRPNDKVAIVVGPEGGITLEELDFLKNNGFQAVGLGPRILRTETVVFYCLSAISYEWELKK